MAQIPNYYFNSPHIGDAARNLASALAPPDPEKTLAAQRAKYEFERAQELARMQDDLFRAHKTGRASLGNIFLNANQPAQVPHSPGEAAYINSQFPNGVPPQGPDPQDVQNVLASDVSLEDLDYALGLSGHGFRQKLALANAAGDMRGDQLTQRLLSNELIAKERSEGIDERFAITNQRLIDMQNDQQAFLDEQKRLDRENRLAVARERKSVGASGNRKPINVGPAQRDTLRRSIRRWYTSQNVDPPLALLDAVTGRSLEYYKEGYNNAPELAIADFHDPEAKMIPGEDPWGSDNATVNSLPLRGGADLQDLLSLLPAVGLPSEPGDEEAAAAGTAPQRPSQLPPMGDPTQLDSSYGGVLAGGQPGLFGQTSLNLGAQGPASNEPGPMAPPPIAGANVVAQPSPDKVPFLKEGKVVVFSDGEAWGMYNGEAKFIPPDLLKIMQGGG